MADRRRHVGTRLLPGVVLTVLALSAPPAVAVDAAGPRGNYMLQCMGCHLLDGSGMAGKVPDMRGIIGKFQYVEGGREFLGRVPGVAQAPIDDAKLTDVLNWTVRNFADPADRARFKPYTVDEVARLRRQPLTDITNTRARLVEKLPAGQ